MGRCVSRVTILAGALAICACGSSAHPPAGDLGGGVPDAALSDTGAAPDTGAGADSGADAGAPADTGAVADATGGDDGPSADGAAPRARIFPDTYASIAILADQLPSMNSAQMQFAASHYVGTQKQLLPVTKALRALNPSFLVLHYHLAMWQSAPGVQFITDGTSWGNDYPTVTTNESWFWHNGQNERVASSSDGKLLMNVSLPAFQNYWAQSLLQQVAAGEYDGVFLDSASPALLQGECSGADPRLAGTAARDTSFVELGGATWIASWEQWIAALTSTLAAQGVPLIPNTSAFVTGWDNTNYGLTPGIFAEGFAGTGFAPSDWQASTDELLTLAAADKVMILQNYLPSADDVATRLYYLGNYLLVKGHHAYLDYFVNGGSPLEWYPEWTVDLGPPTSPATTHSADLLRAGVYRRDFAKGSVFVNPSPAPVTVQLGATYTQVTPSGGGPVDATGSATGTLSMQAVTSVTVAATGAAIVLR